VPLVLLGKILMRRFNGIYLVRFGFRMWEILIFKVISAAENKFLNYKVFSCPFALFCIMVLTNGC